MSKPKKLQQTCKNKNDISTMLIYWTVMVGILLLQQIKTTDAVKYKGDSCVTKSKPGICTEWSECSILKTLIDRGEYTNLEVVSCGFGVREELICCPVVRTETKVESTTNENTDRIKEIFEIPTTTTTTATTQAPERDFWMDLLENLNTTTTTTPTPDFWLDLLTTTSTTSTTSTTTTMKPLIVGEKRLNESSEFFDFNALLNNQGGSQKRQTNEAEFQQNNQHNSAFFNTNSNNNNRRPHIQNTGGFVRPNGNNNNNRGNNLNTGPVNINQWNFEQTSPNERGNNGNHGHQNNAKGNNGFNGWGQENSNNNFRGNNGRGQNNGGNGRGHNNVHGQNHNAGRNSNQNRGFAFPVANENSNQFHESISNGSPTHVPNKPINNINEQNPNRLSNDKNNVDELIKNVFDNNNQNLPINQPTNSDINSGKSIDNLITNVFEVSQTQNNQNNFNSPSTQPGVGLNPHINSSNQVEFVNTHQPTIAAFQTIPVRETHMNNNNDLEAAPSTNFAQQPVEAWSHNPPIRNSEFNPIQMVYENLVNSGMHIVKAQADNVQNVWNQQQQHFGNRPQIPTMKKQFGHHHIPAQFGQFTQQIMQQPLQQFMQRPSQQLMQHPEQPSQQLRQQPQLGQPSQFVHQPQFAQQPSQQFVQQPPQFIQQPLPIAQFPKDSRSAQQPSFAKSANVQSPPSNILDPFKPFEFRPPPEDEMNFSEDNNSLSPNPRNKERPAVRACRRIEKGLTPGLSPHILGGTPAELGEFPHMAAIGYSRIGGDDSPPYDIRCGGTLIDKRFVLTAAHCVSDRESVPSIVRLGVVNFTDVEQMKYAVEIRIKETFIHDDYSTRLTYNDIAILELEREVQTNDIIYPVCLYTNETDPDTKIKLWVSGWGTINTTTRSFSDVLLKAPLHTSPLERCNKSFTEYGLNRRIPEGIIRTQFCAEDKDQIKDACQGDSGGPLHLVVDESYKNYRLVGVVSSGFGCASSTPGLYTRVAAFLDFIERVVWPNGGD